MSSKLPTLFDMLDPDKKVEPAQNVNKQEKEEKKEEIKEEKIEEIKEEKIEEIKEEKIKRIIIVSYLG